MNEDLIPVVCLIIGFAIWVALFGGRLPKPYAQRSCEGKGWRRAFPQASKAEIREFLRVFVDSFAFDESEKLKLSPSDRILDIYRSLYPSKWLADAMEVETFADELETNYGFDLPATWHEDITLGEIFGRLARQTA